MNVADSARRDRSLLVVFTLAVALRAAYLLDVFDSDSVRYLMVDSRAYHERALAILAGDWLGATVFLPKISLRSRLPTVKSRTSAKRMRMGP